MFAINFYTQVYEDMLLKGRKTATIRLGDKSSKYVAGELVWITVGNRFGRRRKLFTAINLACIVLTLVVLMVITSLLETAFYPKGVEGKSDRFLQVFMVRLDGQDGRFIHAPRPGERVRIENVDSPYWRARFNGARRLEPPQRY